MRSCYILPLLLSIFFYEKMGAQEKNESNFFSFPLGIKPKLNANFGEMRPNHFHMGLDISTESRENLPVYAPADGYISRIKIEEGGFGRALYLSHANGMTTLFAHMNRFIPDAEQYLKLKQYEEENWKIDLVIPGDILPIKKGQLIGYSGNTGASQGPHVHMEIRDTNTENCLNPLLLMSPVKDDMAPVVYKLAFYDRNKSIYEQVPLVVPLTRLGDTYKPSNIISLPYNKVFIGISAIDRINGASNQYGIYKASLFSEDQLITSFEMDNIGYDKTRYLNGHIDYMTRAKGGPYYQMLFPPLGFDADIYSPNPAPKYLPLQDSPLGYSIKVYDAYGNSSVVTFQVQGVMKEFQHNEPDGMKMTPGNVNIYEDENVRFVFGEDAFYDGFHFSYNSFYNNESDKISSVIQPIPAYIPVQSYFTVSIKPNRDMVLLNSDRILMKNSFRGRIELKKAMKERDFYTAKFRDFGSLQLLEDLEPPHISANFYTGKSLVGNTRLVIDVSDNNKVIKDFHATLDGKWIMFQPSGNRFFYYPDEHFPTGEHNLSVVVYDEAGNKSTQNWILKR